MTSLHYVPYFDLYGLLRIQVSPVTQRQMLGLAFGEILYTTDGWQLGIYYDIKVGYCVDADSK